MAQFTYAIKAKFGNGQWAYWGGANTMPKVHEIIGRFRRERAEFQRKLKAGAVDTTHKHARTFNVPVTFRVFDDKSNIVHTESVG